MNRPLLFVALVAACAASSAQVSVTIDGKPTVVKWPKDELPFGLREVGGKVYNAAGFEAGSWPFWQNLSRDAAKIDASAAKPYPILIVIPSRRFGIDFSAAVPSFVRNYKISANVNRAPEDIARFAAALRTFSKGQIDPQIDVVIDTSTQDSDPKQTLAARGNTVRFDGDDPAQGKGYRAAWVWDIPGDETNPMECLQQLFQDWHASASARQPGAFPADTGRAPWGSQWLEGTDIAKLLSESEPADSVDFRPAPEAARIEALPVSADVRWQIVGSNGFEKTKDGEMTFVEMWSNRIGSVEYRAVDGLHPLQSVTFTMLCGWQDVYQAQLGLVNLATGHRIWGDPVVFRPTKGQSVQVTVPGASPKGAYAIESVRITGIGEKTSPDAVQIVFSPLEFGKPHSPAPFAAPAEEGIIPSLATTEDVAVLKQALETPNLGVIAAALHRLGNFKAPTLALRIGELANGSHPGLAQVAARALAFQDTPESKALMYALSDRPTFDHNLDAIARVIIAKPDKIYVGALGNALSASSWVARRSAVQALAAIRTSEASQTMAIFINDPEPMVRIEVARLADLSQDTARRRVLYAAANDPSEQVRAAAVINLLGTDPASATFKEGLSRISDDSWVTRAAIAAGAPLKEEVRPLLMQATRDPSATVRAAALERMALLPKGIAIEALAHLKGDGDRRVEEVWLALLEGNKVSSPELLDRLSQSKHPGIRARAGALHSK